jgi:hypothetical protein
MQTLTKGGRQRRGNHLSNIMIILGRNMSNLTTKRSEDEECLGLGFSEKETSQTQERKRAIMKSADATK